MEVTLDTSYELSTKENSDEYLLKILITFVKAMPSGGYVYCRYHRDRTFHIGTLLINMIDNNYPNFIESLFGKDILVNNDSDPNEISPLEKKDSLNKFVNEIKNSLQGLEYCVDQVLRIDDKNILRDFSGNNQIVQDLSERNSIPPIKRLLLLDFNDLSDRVGNTFLHRSTIDMKVTHEWYAIKDGNVLNLSGITRYVKKVDSSPYGTMVRIDGEEHRTYNEQTMSYSEKIQVLKDADVVFQTKHTFNSLIDLLYFEFYEMIKRNIPVRKCLLCGKWFLPIDKRDRQYCMRIFKDMKTCKEIGASERYNEKVKKDPALNEFEKARDRRLKRKKNDYDGGEYAFWIDEAILYRDKYLNGEITSSEFIKWLDSDRLRKKKGDKANGR